MTFIEFQPLAWMVLAPLPLLIVFYFLRNHFVLFGYIILIYGWIIFCSASQWEGFGIILQYWDHLSIWEQILPQLDAYLIFACLVAFVVNSFALGQGLRNIHFGKLATSGKLTGAEQAKSGAHGTGRLMSQREAKRVFDKDKGFILAQTQSGRFYRYKDAGHIFVEAASRAGKGVSGTCVHGMDYEGPIVTLDPKIENFFIWARNRLSLGHDVYLLDPLNIASKIENNFEEHGVHACVKRASFNILGFFDTTSPNFYSQVEEIAHNLKPNDADKVTDPFWIDAPAGVLITFILWVCCAPEEEVEGPRTLETVRHYCFHPEPDMLIETWKDRTEIANGSLSRHIRDMDEFKGNQRGYASIVKIARTWLSFLEDVGTCKSLCGEIGQSFKSSDILKGDTDIFLGVPLEMLETQPQFARIVITALFHEVLRAHGAVNRRILFLLDEMARIGYLPVLESALAATAGMGATMICYVQSFSQLEAKWGETRAKAFFEGFHVYQYFGVTANNAKRTADLIGETTVVDRSITKGAGDSYQLTQIAGTTSDNKGESRQHRSRHLITADELKTMPEDEIIIQAIRQPPLRAKRVKYYEHPHFAGKFDPNPYLFIEDF